MIETISWSAGALAGLAGWWWLLKSTPSGLGGNAPSGKWSWGDGVFAAILSLYFILGLLSDRSEDVAITQDLVRGGLYIYVIVSIFFVTLVLARGQTLAQAFGIDGWPSRRVVGLGALCLLLTYPVVQLSQIIMTSLGQEPGKGDQMVKFLRGDISPSDLAWSFALVVIVAPITEELVFRGYLYGVLKKYGGRIPAMCTSSLLFAAIHHNLPAMPALTLLGIGLALAYELTGSLIAAIVMHMIFNLIPLVAIIWFPQWMTQL